MPPVTLDQTPKPNRREDTHVQQPKLNGAPGKQLRDQLDRLDTLIDALDMALAEAVRDAVAATSARPSVGVIS